MALRDQQTNIDPIQTAERLQQLGLTPEVLTDSIQHGVRAAERIGSTHPPTAQGFTLWSESVAYLRAQLTADGWRQANPQNQPRAISPDEKVSIIVVSGNERTGVSQDIPPNTVRRRGSATQRAIDTNGQQRFEFGEPWDLRHRDADTACWMLLYHWSRVEPRIQLELSLPVESIDGFVVSWRERIILPPVDLSNTDLGLNLSAPTDDVPFDISGLA